MTVTLSAADEHGALPVSGVAVTHYRVDAGPWQTGTSVEVTGDGEHTVSYYSTDNAGNDEAVKQSTTVSIATTPPGASSDDAPAGWTRLPVTVTLTPGARALRTTWELDGAASQTGTSVAVGAPADHSGDGVHTITYRSWAFGDVAEPTRTAVVRVDTAAPATSDAAPAGWQSGAVTVTLSPSDTASGVAATTWSLDGGAAHSGTSVPVSGDGVHVDQLLVHRQRRQHRGLAHGHRADRRHGAGGELRRGRPLVQDAGRHRDHRRERHGRLGRDLGRVPRRPGDWQAGTAAPLAGAGAHAVAYRVTDAAGNVTSGQCVVGIDTGRPTKVKALTSTGKKGKLTLKFKISDPKPGCGVATVSKIVVTTAKGKKVKTIKGLTGTVVTNAKVKLVVKKKLTKGSYRFKVYVTDIAGNTSKKATPGKLTVK